jgi:putative nucleotidyltransferase with HDIG domain
MEALNENRKQAMRQRLRDIQSLPTLPPIVARLNQMVEDEDVTALQLGLVIEKDQVLTSKLLKMVNSSFFGFPQRISTVPNAIVLLGFNVIKTLIVSSSIFEVMQSSDVGLWEHSLGCATAAGILAKRLKIKNPEEVSTAGLIHDLGKIVIRSEIPEEYARIKEAVRNREIPMREAEIEFLGIGHGEIGGWLSQQWNLPARLVQAIEYHHHPEDAPEYREIAGIVHFSDTLIRAIGFGFGGDPWVPPLDRHAWNRLKFSRTETKEILRDLDQRLLDLQDFTMEIQKMD